MRPLKSIWKATWKTVLFLLLWGILYSPAILLFNVGKTASITPQLRLYIEILGAVSVTLAAWVMVRVVDRRAFISLGFVLSKAGRDSFIGLGLGSAMIGLAVAILWLAGWTETNPITNFSWSVLGLISAIVLFNAVTQEVLVRGYILQTIETQSNAWIAVIVSSLIFTAMHAGGLIEGGLLPATNIFAAGVLLGLAYTTTRNLWLPISLHFAWNFLQGPVLGIAVSGQDLDSGWQLVTLDGPAIFSGGSFGLEGGLIGTLVTVLGMFVVYMLGHVRERHASPATTQ